MQVEDKSNRGVFDQGTRVLHRLTAAFMLSVFVLAFSIDLATSRAAHIAFLQLHRLMGLAVWLGEEQLPQCGTQGRYRITEPRVSIKPMEYI
jgi:hypothetical protein